MRYKQLFHKSFIILGILLALLLVGCEKEKDNCSNPTSTECNSTPTPVPTSTPEPTATPEPTPEPVIEQPTPEPQPTATPVPPESVDIYFTYVPPIGSFDNLYGRVTGVNFSEHRVVCYIYVPKWKGWWIKPYSRTTVPIASNGEFSVDITTGGIDSTATKVAAFLIKQSYTPPNVLGKDDLPDIKSLASVMVNR